MPHNMSNKMTSSPIFLFKRTFPLTHYLKRSCFLRKQLLAFVSSVLFSCVTSIFIGTFMILLYLIKNAFVLSGSFVPHCDSSVPAMDLLYFTTDLLCLVNAFVSSKFLLYFQILSYFPNSFVIPKMPFPTILTPSQR